MRTPVSFLLLLALAWSCSSPEAPQASTAPVKVQHAGALKNIMHEGDISAKADLRDLSGTEHLYALGAVENLKGEILVLDGEPYISFVEPIDEEALVISRTFEHKASLLVHSVVEQWKSFAIPDSVHTYQELEQYVEITAAAHGIDTEEAFPFLLNGKTAEFEWHVIDWEEGDMDHSHEKHIRSGAHGTEQDQEVDILGFYSKHHHAVFTHHSTNMHLHVKTRNDDLAGHVDALTLGESMTIQLPVVN